MVQIEKFAIVNFKSGPVQIENISVKNFKSGLVQIEKNPIEKNDSGPVQITDLDLTFYTHIFIKNAAAVEKRYIGPFRRGHTV